jgi:NAD(P)-dependent dehydrogenase (short-subunit alcohol dehydrogenase family)
MTDELHALADRTLVMSGGSRGIGLAIALGAAKLGANVVLLAETGEPHPKLPGTVHTAVAEIEAADGKGLAVDADVLIASGVTDLSRYGGGDDPMWDIFLDKS